MMNNWFHSSQSLLTGHATQELFIPSYITYDTLHSDQIKSKITVYFFTV